MFITSLSSKTQNKKEIKEEIKRPLITDERNNNLDLLRLILTFMPPLDILTFFKIIRISLSKESFKSLLNDAPEDYKKYFNFILLAYSSAYDPKNKLPLINGNIVTITNTYDSSLAFHGVVMSFIVLSKIKSPKWMHEKLYQPLAAEREEFLNKIFTDTANIETFKGKNIENIKEFILLELKSFQNSSNAQFLKDLMNYITKYAHSQKYPDLTISTYRNCSSMKSDDNYLMKSQLFNYMIAPDEVLYVNNYSKCEGYAIFKFKGLKCPCAYTFYSHLRNDEHVNAPDIFFSHGNVTDEGNYCPNDYEQKNETKVTDVWDNNPNKAHAVITVKREQSKRKESKREEPEILTAYYKSISASMRFQKYKEEKKSSGCLLI